MSRLPCAQPEVRTAALLGGRTATGRGDAAGGAALVSIVPSQCVEDDAQQKDPRCVFVVSAKGNQFVAYYRRPSSCPPCRPTVPE